MNSNIEKLARQILQAEKISSPPIIAEKLAKFYFGLDFDWDNLSDVNAAKLSITQKKIYMNELRKEDFVANIGFKNFTIAHELGHWVLHRNLTHDIRTKSSAKRIYSPYICSCRKILCAMNSPNLILREFRALFPST